MMHKRLGGYIALHLICSRVGSGSCRDSTKHYTLRGPVLAKEDSGASIRGQRGHYWFHRLPPRGPRSFRFAIQKIQTDDCSSKNGMV